MKTKKIFFVTFSALLSGTALLSGCSDDNTTGEVATTSYTYQLSADISDTATVTTTAKGARSLRSLREGTGSTVISEWEIGDQIIAYNLSDNDKSTKTQYSLLAAQFPGKMANFDGTFNTVNPMTTTDNLCFFYPGAASVGTDRVITPVVRRTGNGTTTPAVYHEAQSTIKRLVGLNLSKQDGTIETIGKKFDFQWAKTTPLSINGSDVKVYIGNMQRKIAHWALRFADKKGNILTNIDSISISNVRSTDAFDLGTGAFVTDNSTEEGTEIVLKPQSGTKFTSAGGKYTYVAMFPGTYKDVLIMVYAGDACYVQSYSSVTFAQDNVYRTNVLGMENADTQPSVEVQGVKWATGNFIHYGTVGNNDYWGIAPSQWWISDYYASDGTGGYTTSQYLTGHTSRPENLDLFRYGDITNALDVTSNTYKYGNVDISKKFYSNSGLIAPEVTTNINYGDIVWYHTRDDNQKYRMPTNNEMRTLYDNSHVLAAYCYTDKGQKIYGAYFYTAKTGETRVNTIQTTDLSQYKDVTRLVRANRGLFLPIAGKRVASSSRIDFRDIGKYAEGAYGQYMSSQSSSLAFTWDLFFGPETWGYVGNAKDQSRAIRPVWDPSSSNTPNPEYEPFQGIK